MLAVINTSSGQSFGTQNVFPQHIANGSFDGTGAEAHIIKKDLGLFVDGAAAEGSPGATIAEAYRAIAAFSDAEPTQDKARIYPFVRDEMTPTSRVKRATKPECFLEAENPWWRAPGARSQAR